MRARQASTESFSWRGPSGRATRSLCWIESLRGFLVHVVIRLDPPLPLTTYKDLHQLRLDHPISRHCDATRHAFHTTNFIVDVTMATSCVTNRMRRIM